MTGTYQLYQKGDQKSIGHFKEITAELNLYQRVGAQQNLTRQTPKLTRCAPPFQTISD